VPLSNIAALPPCLFQEWYETTFEMPFRWAHLAKAFPNTLFTAISDVDDAGSRPRPHRAQCSGRCFLLPFSAAVAGRRKLTSKQFSQITVHGPNPPQILAFYFATRVRAPLPSTWVLGIISSVLCCVGDAYTTPCFPMLVMDGCRF